ncbi:MAG: hypothetical protein J7L38_07790 [Thermoproteales archaeon]|nr:hypothetical protein [Thermoproteales archaeon]
MSVNESTNIEELYGKLVEYYSRYCSQPGLYVESKVRRLVREGYSREEAVLKLYKQVFRVQADISELLSKDVGLGSPDLRPIAKMFLVAVFLYLLLVWGAFLRGFKVTLREAKILKYTSLALLNMAIGLLILYVLKLEREERRMASTRFFWTIKYILLALGVTLTLLIYMFF